MNRRKPNIDRLSSSSLALLVAVAALLQLTGCRSDPYCNQAIANYRAEVQTLQDEYYFLKARYEADMAKAGQPIPQISPLGAGQSSLDSIVDGQYYGEVVQGIRFTRQMEPTSRARFRPSPTCNPNPICNPLPKSCQRQSLTRQPVQMVGRQVATLHPTFASWRLTNFKLGVARPLVC